MALIGKIREKSWLLIAVIGIAMLAFIIGDFNLGGDGPQEDVYGIGTVDGEKVNEDRYNQFLNNARNNIMQNKQQQNPTQQVRFTEEDDKNATSQAWQTSIIDGLMRKEYEEIGLIVDEYELENILYGQNGYKPSAISTQFKDSVTGEFAPDQLRQALDQLRESPEPGSAQQYKDLMDYVAQVRMEEKYNALITSGVHTTSLEGKHEFTAKKTVKNVTYVYQNYTTVPNDAVAEPTDEELKKYFNDHKNDKKYAQKASRKISYFVIPVNPSKEDSTKSFELLNKMKPKFASSKNDSLFVMRYSDLKRYANDSTSMAKPEGVPTQGPTYPASVAAQMENANKGDVIGPYIGQNGAKISKVLGFGEEKTASVRHILLNASSTEEFDAAQIQADSIIKVIRSKNNFEAMVTEFSEDPGSVNNGGKYEKFPQGQMVPEFNDFSFFKPIGTIGTVKTTYGIHIVEVLDREATKRPILADVIKSIEATKTTADQVNSEASNYIYDLDDQFSGKSNKEKAEAFEKYAVEQGYTVRFATIQDEEPTVAGFNEIAEGRILRLAYENEAKAGTLSSSPIRDKNRIIVALVSDIIEKGVPRLETVEDVMRAELRKEKQANYLIDQMLGEKDLQALSTKTGAKLESEGLTFSASNVAVGREPQIIGTAFSGLVDGETSVPVKGTNGVFVLRVDQTTAADEETTDFSAEIEQIKAQNISTIENQFRSALIQSSDVIDNRKLRRYGIR
ncbi:peptidylprolyl isomerase [Brumimicrobium mesophilum]|uniref:peptidylprolyl isomerase n=1 Tax=Brumimicrobium mesophilum TaxID=392717 RepID=UPI000D142196|nr:peptidylprolyl isomerase [Brumimicrobium mesophilum]